MNKWFYAFLCVWIASSTAGSYLQLAINHQHSEIIFQLWDRIDELERIIKSEAGDE